VAGYKAVLVAAHAYGGFFPVLVTAAGTARPARVLVLGAGVAGLQAIGTARRLGAVVTAYDVRPEARAEIESVGGTFLDLGPTAESSGGYARALSATEQQAQREALSVHIGRFDVVITTAQVPGGRPPAARRERGQGPGTWFGRGGPRRRPVRGQRGRSPAGQDGRDRQRRHGHRRGRPAGDGTGGGINSRLADARLIVRTAGRRIPQRGRADRSRSWASDGTVVPSVEGLCLPDGRRMEGSLNHGRLYYRCAASRDYVRQHGISPPVPYLREDAIADAVDRFLHGELGERTLTTTLRHMADAQHARPPSSMTRTRLPTSCARQSRTATPSSAGTAPLLRRAPTQHSSPDGPKRRPRSRAPRRRGSGLTPASRLG